MSHIVDRATRWGLALLALAAVAPAAAHAGTSFSVVSGVPSSMTVGSGSAASLTLTNVSFDSAGESGYDTDSYRLSALAVVLGCGSPTVTTDCPFGQKDGGAIVPSATGTGRSTTACEGSTFTIAQVGSGLDGKYAFTASPQVVLGASSGAVNGRRCIVDFTVSAVRSPAIDSSPATPGLQTATSGYGEFADVTAGLHQGESGAGVGTSIVTVSPAQPAIATRASPTTSLGAASLTDQATVSGLANPVSGAGAGTLEFRVYGPNDLTCTTATATYSGVALTLNGPQTQGTAVSPPFSPSAVGTYRWRAFYSGDANNAPISGACNATGESTVALPAQPTLVTQASPSIPLGGGTLSDQATVSGLVSPAAGTVQFRLYGPNDATCASAPIATYSGVALTLNGPHTQGTATSPSFAPTIAGTYRWRAFYSGDANHSAVNGACNAPEESTVVVVPQSSIATVASPGIALGGSLTDQATVSGLVNPAGGTVEFRVYGPDDAACTTLVESFAGVALTLNGAHTSATATSPQFSPTVPGTYRWRAFYSGDASNAAVNEPCNAPNESATVTSTATPPPPPPPPPPSRGAPSISTLASSTVVLGGQVRDSAVLTGRVDPVAGSTIEFRLYGPDDATCASAPVFATTAPLSAAGTATSAAFTPARAGTYRWRAFYGGDANNDAASGFCNAAGERVVVTPPDGPRIVSAGFTAPPRVGSPARLVVTAGDLLRPIAGVRVRFGEPRGVFAILGCQAPTLALPRPIVRQEVLYTFRQAGRHLVEITVLSGGCSGPQLRTTTTLDVTVAPRAAARAGTRTAVSAAAAPFTAAGCRDRLLTPTLANRDRVAAAVLCLVDVERRKRARKQLARGSRLALAAARHSTDMFGRVYLGHAHAPGGPSLVARLRRAGYRGPTYAENIAYVADANASRVVQGWMNSPPHRANILDLRLKFVGVGIAIGIPDTPPRPGATFTLDFGGTAR